MMQEEDPERFTSWTKEEDGLEQAGGLERFSFPVVVCILLLLFRDFEVYLEVEGTGRRGSTSSVMRMVRSSRHHKTAYSTARAEWRLSSGKP